MAKAEPTPIDALCSNPPFDSLPEGVRAGLAPHLRRVPLAPGEVLFAAGDPLEGFYLVEGGALDIVTGDGKPVSRRGPGDMMGERGLLRDGTAQLTARAVEPTRLVLVPADRFLRLMDEVPEIGQWFARARPLRHADDGPDATGLTALQVSDLMAKTPITCTPETTVTEVARLMREHVISSVLVMEGARLAGIITSHDLTNKVLAEGLSGSIPVARVMTPDPVTIAPTQLGLDALLKLAELGVNHLPVAQDGRVVGMIGKTDLFRQQAATASHMVADIASAGSAAEMARVMDRVPGLLAQLVQAGVRPQAVTRRITDITDAITRRLLRLAEEELGPAPVPWLWAACGSQGRREQTGVSDQDNCLILDDGFDANRHDDYFAALARYVVDGLDHCGFVYCPGDMMATNPRWRQPRRVWRRYFAGWIAQPDNEAQMLASVMFDLRPIAGEAALFDDLQAEVLAASRRNSIFVAHMIANSLKHSVPLGLFRGFALIRSGEHRNTIDLKHSGVIPVVDLGRIYALVGALDVTGTRDRIEAGRAAGVVSESGAHDLLDAYDLVAETRLRHQAAQILRGDKPDNFMNPAELSDLERNHLRDAFMVIKTMQSAVGQSRGVLT
ncbi:MAG: cyclic nucleotide-binding/CBS domain-containing protein [Roseovarius sp.]|nr:cyclic nucleotide-binding/CBS domain-containing protein [Roseovarius sp.]